MKLQKILDITGKPQTAGGFPAALGRCAPNSAQIAQKVLKLEVPIY